MFLLRCQSKNSSETTNYGKEARTGTIFDMWFYLNTWFFSWKILPGFWMYKSLDRYLWSSLHRSPCKLMPSKKQDTFFFKKWGIALQFTWHKYLWLCYKSHSVRTCRTLYSVFNVGVKKGELLQNRNRDIALFNSLLQFYPSQIQAVREVNGTNTEYRVLYYKLTNKFCKH